MKRNIFHRTKRVYLFGIMIFFVSVVQAQTDLDGIMMNKKQFCNGPMYIHSAWDHYWEGKLERTNLNLGTVSTQALSYMAAYGITNNINILAGAPYVWT